MHSDCLHGSCLCGAVTFKVDPPLRPVVVCHCTQCRKWSGHVWAATSVPHDRFRLVRDEGLRWFRSSAEAQRGFCSDCGASLFWQPEGEDRISFAPAALEGDTGLETAEHIFIEAAGDYYSPEGPPPPPGESPQALLASCLCGAVRFSLKGPAGEVTGCHCRQCRTLSGHFAASFGVDETALVAEAGGSVAEYRTPGGGARGFCADCGSSLWFRAGDGAVSVEAGCIDGPTGGRLAHHIHVADKGDYYALDDGLPQSAGG